MGLGCSLSVRGRRRTSASDGSAYYSRSWVLQAQLNKRHFVKTATPLWTFDHRINYVGDTACRFQPWVTGGRYLTPVLTTSDYFELGAFVPLISQTHGKFLLVIEKCHKQLLSWKTVKFPRPVSFDGLDETRSGAERAVQVIGAREEMLVLQVVRPNGLFEGYLLKDRLGVMEVVRSISFPCHRKESFTMEAVISPDSFKVLLKPSWVYLEQEEGVADNCVFLLDVSLDNPVSATMFLEQGAGSVMTFDPRFAWSRVALGSRRHQSKEVSEQFTVVLMDMKTQRQLSTYTQTTSLVNVGIQNLTYSPDGRFLAAVTGIVLDSSQLKILPKDLYFLDSDSLCVLKTFPNIGPGHEVPVTPFCIFPIFSRESRYVAFMCYPNRREQVKVVAIPVHLTLRNLCRVWLRKLLPQQEALMELPLSKSDVDYLLYRYPYD